MNTQRVLLLAFLVVGSATFLPTRAHAQLSMGGGQGGQGGGGQGGGAADDTDKKKPAPPSSIPGAVAIAPVVPASKSAEALDPNAALFDAIDRGDIGAAREALGRGADLSAHNVLGQRPIDLSIDLSRNDITFLLLSMRSQNGDQAPAADSSADTAEADPDQLPSRTTQPAVGAPAGAQFASTGHATGGTPQPSAGFLGFGAR